MPGPSHRLVNLNPVWISSGGFGIHDKDGNPVPEREKIGLMFDCPACITHPERQCRVPVFFENPFDGKPPFDPTNPKRARWRIVSGTTFEDIRLAPSILTRRHQGYDCPGWHGHVGLRVPGEVTTC